MQCLGSSGGWWVTYFANPSKVCAGGCGNGLGVISDCRCYNTAWRLVGFRKIHTYFGIAYNWPDDPDRQLDVVPTPPEAAEFVIKFVITCWAAIFEFDFSNMYTVAVPDTTVRFFNILGRRLSDHAILQRGQWFHGHVMTIVCTQAGSSGTLQCW